MVIRSLLIGSGTILQVILVAEWIILNMYLSVIKREFTLTISVPTYADWNSFPLRICMLFISIIFSRIVKVASMK